MVRKRREKVKDAEKTIAKTDIPLAVKIISVLGYIEAAVLFLSGIMMAVVFFMIAKNPSILETLKAKMLLEPGTTTEMVNLVSVVLQYSLLFGLFFIGIGILEAFVARGLWTGKNWARIVAIVFMAVGFINALIKFKIFSILVNGIIGGYLLFSRKVERAFSRNRAK